MFFAKIPRHTRQNAITEGDLECILTRNCEGTEQLRIILKKDSSHFFGSCPFSRNHRLHRELGTKPAQNYRMILL